MGFNNTDALRVVIDIETAPLPEAGQYLEPAEPPVNYKDPEKIAAYCVQKNAENLSRASLDVDLCRIVAIGYQQEDWKRGPITMTAEDAQGETSIIRTFWKHVGQRVTVGYNTLGFDLPVLLRRSLYLGVQHPYVSLDKYRTSHIDLQMRLSFNGQIKFRPLSFYCKRFGIVCEDETTGKDIGQLVIEGKWDDIAAHCRTDVLKAKALAERMGLLKQQVEPVEGF